MGGNRSAIEHVISSTDADAISGRSTYCVGCGACTLLDPAFNIAKNSDGCYYANISGAPREGGAIASSVCPFAAGVDENEIARDLFSAQTDIQHDQYLGYYLKTYVGFVNEDGWRSRGSSGGFVSWLAATLLREGLIDAVVHVKDGPDSEHMYRMQFHTPSMNWRQERNQNTTRWR